LPQPIRLILPDFFQSCPAKLTEHAAHVDMVIGAVAQHGLRVAPITEWLQRQKCGRYVTSLLAPRSTILSIRCSPTPSVGPA